MRRRYFQAESTGALVSHLSRSGKVASLHSGAANILLQEGLVVSLVQKREQMSALSVQVSTLFGVDGSRRSSYPSCMAPGANALLLQRQLILDELVIELNRGARWSGRLRPGDVEGLRVDSIPLLQTALLAGGKVGGLLTVLSPGSADSPHAARAQRVLGNVSLNGDPPAFAGLAGLVGLGPGATPSGDDFLCGALLGEGMLLAAGHSKQRRPQVGSRSACRLVQKAELEARLDGTTAGGRTILWQALQGRFPFYLIHVGREIAAARGAEEMSRAVRSAVAHGQTSGTDALAGLVWYLKRASELL